MLIKRLITASMALTAILLVWTCAELNEDETGTHPEGWTESESPLFHGYKVAESGTEFCESCHGEDFSGGTADVACSQCHASYPHPTGFAFGDSIVVHGTYLAGTGFDLTECANCHGDDWTGGISAPACLNACHSVYPHAAGFADSDTTGYHGDLLAAIDFNLTSCEGCHGDDYLGGETGTSCYTCHAAFPHPNSWTNPTSADFHGQYLAGTGFVLTSCQGCHGDDFAGGDTGVTCYTCHATFPHASGWTTPTSADFHAKYLAGINFNLNSCKGCHGDDFSGGDTGVSCYDCHANFPHANDWTTPASDDFHGKHLYGTWYNINACADCHASDLTGGTYAPACSNAICHTATEGVYACDNCHSYIDVSTANDAAIAAFEFSDLQGNTDLTSATAGVHTSHIARTHGLTNSIDCSTCHIVPASFSDATHIDATQYADVTFDTTGFSTHLGDTGQAWIWDRTNRTCDNTYCHGNFAFGSSGDIVGNDSTWTWNVPATGELCSKCHNLPPEGHFATASNCGLCHGSVADPAANIILEAGRDLHINGEKNQP